MKKQILIVIHAILIFWLYGCKKSYFDINNNPNNATSATPDLVLPNALVTTASPLVVGNQVNYNIFISAWMGYIGQSGSYAAAVGDVASYKQTTNFGNPNWLYDYHNLEDYDYVEKSALSQNLYFYAGAAKIMKAYVFQHLVDAFNNVPYSQAFQGTNNITPSYDSAQSVYNAITTQIDTAIVLLSRADAVGTAKSDVLFGGNNALWIQFANTLKLRILIRQSQVSSNASFIQSEIAKITSNSSGFLSSDAAVNPGYANNAGQQNPVWGFYVTLTGLPVSGGHADLWKGGQYTISWLQTNNDPRYHYIYSLDSGGKGSTYLGSILGSVSNPPGVDASSFGPGILKSVGQPAVILSAAESYFLQAEAILRGWLPGSDSAAFANGVAASFNFLGAGDPTAYLSQNNNQTNYGVCTTTAEKLACIIRQKWIASDQVTPFEAWCDYRRLKLPADIPLSISPFLDQAPASIPIRLLYPTNEYQTNAANVNAQGTIDYHASRVFWNQ
jgi:Starch-binding associating with outer membrane